LPKIDSKQGCYSTVEANGGTELVLTIDMTGLISDNNQAKFEHAYMV